MPRTHSGKQNYPGLGPHPTLEFFSGTTHASIIITRFKIKHTMYMYIDLRV